MSDLIKFKKGNKANLPNLNVGEPALVLDEEKLYIGGNNGNIAIPNKKDMNEIVDKIGILNTQLADIPNQTYITEKAKTDDVNKALALKADKIEINSLATAKADKTALDAEKTDRQAEIAIERARINSFTALAAGSTTGDAELKDGRIGADGVTYANLGGAIRYQIETVKENDYGIGKIIGGIDGLQFQRGTLYNGKGYADIGNWHRIYTKNFISFNYDCLVESIDKANYCFIVDYKDTSGSLTDEFGNKVSTTNARDTFTIPKNTEFRMCIRKITETPGSYADIKEYKKKINMTSTLDFYIKKTEYEEKSKAEFDNYTQNIKDFNVRKADYQERHPIITFTTDDGTVFDYNLLKPLSVKYGVPFTSAIITSLIGKSATDVGTEGYAHMTVAQMQELQNTYGWEMASHTDSHRVLSNLTYDEIETEMTKSQNILNGYGLRCKTIVYPQGGNNATVRRIASKYYRSGVIVQDGSGVFKLNKGCVPSYYIVRCNLGSYFDKNLPGIPVTNTYEYYKYLVDQAIANNAWLVFELHTWNSDFNATQQKYLDDLIAYIKTTTATIETVNSALDYFGNYLEAGDFLGIWNQTGWAVNKLGQFQGKIPTRISTTGRNALANVDIGDMVFDTTLNKPVWRNATGNGWVDAMGTPV